MKFASVRIHNLFSYRNELFEFPLDAPTEKNVVLIHGRNGFGKTSFINAIKLIFLGLHPELTYNVRPGYKMPPEEYLRGGGIKWEGAFNRNALREGESTCGVFLRWHEEAGFVNLARTWTLDRRQGFTESLTINPEFPVAEEELQDQEQREGFLERRLPKALLPFFIYDAEQVQNIADASMEEGTIEQIERLLDITTTRLAEDALGRVLKKLRTTGNARAEQIRLDNLRNRLEAQRIRKSGIEAKIAEKEAAVAEIKYGIQQLEEGIERSRDISRRNEMERRQATQNLDQFRVDLEAESFAFLDAFPSVAPFVVHSGKVSAAIERLENALQSGRSGLEHELREILERIPGRLFDEPQHPRPPLEEGQIRFLKAKLSQLLQAEINVASTDQPGSTWRLDPERARRLVQTLRRLTDIGELDHIRRLKEISRLKSGIRQAEAAMADVSALPDDERIRVEERLVEKAKLENDVEREREEIGALRQGEPEISREIERLRTEVSSQERVLVIASRNQFGVELADRLLTATRNYRDLLRERRREDIQNTVNARFRQLMESHRQVHEIRFSNDFRFSYFDAEGRSVGMANISAGMKQLAAQALLWGLKDLAEQDCPVVIDTPLARIDAGHQRRLITGYYPQAGQQVIVLPTDSELDREKYALLKPHIAREMRLHNDTGESTRVEFDSPMFQ